MRIMVCVKQVIDVRTVLGVDKKKGIVIAPGIPPVINRADIAALEAAMDLKERTTNVEILGLTIGPAWAETALQYCLARGVDAAWRIWEEGIKNDDPYVIAKIIARVAKIAHCSLIMCGQISDDTRSGLIPAVIAEKENWPWITRAISLTLGTDCAEVIVSQKGEKGSRIELSCNLPAIVAFEPVVPRHQYVSVRRLVSAEDKPIKVFNLRELSIEFQEVDGTQSPIKILKMRPLKPRTKRTTLDFQGSTGEELMWKMISGPSGKTAENNLVSGEPTALAGRILDFLSEKGIFCPVTRPSRNELSKSETKLKITKDKD